MPNYNPGGQEKSSSDKSARNNKGGRGNSPGSPGRDPRDRDPSTYRGNSKGYREQRIQEHHRQYLKSQQQQQKDEQERRRREAARLKAIEDRRVAAVNARNAAVNTMMDAINTAFAGEYDEDYYGDRTSAFNAFANPLLTSGYDDALRGIYEGFREAGVFDTDAFNTQKGALDTAKAEETTRLGTLAKAYTQRVKDAVEAAKTGVTGDLGKLYGDDSVSAKDAAAQQAAVEGFTYNTDITTPEFTREDDPDTEDVDETIAAPVFFQNFRKLSDQGIQTAANQAASGRTAPAAASGRMSTRNFSFQNPVSQGSSRIIG
tara:strand:+ start:37 stop:987 length:951 start_codon:yes stop_codon:yes gene_type:complete